MVAPTMMPGNVLATVQTPARFTGAKALAVSRTIDYEDGGVAIQDASQGLFVQRWRARLINSNSAESYVLLDAPLVPEFIVLELPFLTEISFTFDQNMNIALAYVQSGIAFFQWYDNAVQGYVTTNMGVSVKTPRVVLDDKRILASNFNQTNDIILAYIIGETLRYRQQRDRYEIERILLPAGVKTGLIKLGLNRQLRLQFMLEVG